MSKDNTEEAKRKNYEDLKRAGESRKQDQSPTNGPQEQAQNSPAAAKRARKDANAAKRPKRSWIARERALAAGSPTLIKLVIATAQGMGRRFASLR